MYVCVSVCLFGCCCVCFFVTVSLHPNLCFACFVFYMSHLVVLLYMFVICNILHMFVVGVCIVLDPRVVMVCVVCVCMFVWHVLCCKNPLLSLLHHRVLFSLFVFDYLCGICFVSLCVMCSVFLGCLCCVVKRRLCCLVLFSFMLCYIRVCQLSSLCCGLFVCVSFCVSLFI